MTTTGTGSRKLASVMELEPRLMFDGAAVATVAAEATADPAQDAAPAPATPQASAASEADDGQTVAEALVALGAPAAGQEASRQVVIIDGGISDKDAILKAIPSGADVYVLPADADGVAMIADILAQYEDLDAVHVVSHGQDGGILLGTATLDAGNATAHADALGRWGAALSDSGDILLYGCATGSGAEGLAFLQTLAELTGADIAASEDSTGASALDGDWDLERSTGTIEAEAIVATDFSGLLVTTPVNGRADFGSRYNWDSFNNPYSSSFTSGNINDLGWVAKITPSAGQTASLLVDDSGNLSWRGNDPSTQNARIAAMSLLTASGTDIDLLQLKIDTGYPATVTLTGYRNGSAVSGYSKTVSVPYGGATTVLAWENVDEVRFSLSNYPSNQSQVFNIAEVTTGPIPALTGMLQDASNSLAEGADGALALGGLAFSHGGVTTTNLTISANGGLLSATSSGTVTVTGSGTGALTLTGSAADIDAWLNTSTNITYNSGAMSGTDVLELSFSTKYLDVTIDHGTRTLDITEVDQQARFKALPDSFAGRVGIAKLLDFSDADLFDADSESVDFKLTMSVDSGTLAISGGTIWGLTVTGSGTDTLVFSGPPYLVESWFNDASRPITYTGVTEGIAVLTLSGTDTDTGAYSIGTVDINVAPPNTAPTVTGLPSLVTLTEDMSGALDLSGLVISDADSSGAFTITIGNPLLYVGATSADGVTVTTMTGGRTISLTGTVAALTAYLADASRVILTPQADASGMNYTTITVSVDDGDDNVVTNTIQADVTPVDDPSSFIGDAGPLNVTEDTPKGLDISRLTLIDLDSEPQTLILTVEHGILTMSSMTKITVTGSGTSRLTVTGTPSDLNMQFLDYSSIYLRYTPEADQFGPAADTLTLSSPSPSGGEDIVLRSIDINIAGLNDAPTMTGLPPSLTIVENQATPLDLSSVVLTDVDSSAPTFRLFLAAMSGGYLSASSGDGVMVTGSGTSFLTLTGRVSDIQAWLSSGTPISLQGRPNVSAPSSDTLQFQGSDGDGANVNFAYVPVTIEAGTGADVPTLSFAPSKLTAVEETPTAFDLSALALTAGGASPTAAMTLHLSVGHGILEAVAFGTAVLNGSGTSTLTITGTIAEITDWLASATAVTYTANVDVAGNRVDAIAVRISNGESAGLTSIGAINIDVTNVNDAPAPTGFPSTITTATNTTLVLNLAALRLNDPDAMITSPAQPAFKAVLSVTSGTLNYIGGPAGFVVSGAGTTSLTLTAPIWTLEAFLKSGRVTYTPPTDAHGPGIDALTLVVNDGAGSGDVTAATATINVAPPNAAPTLTDLPASVSGDEDATFAIDLSGAILSDGDSPDADFALTLTADAGTLAATSAGGVTVTGNGSGKLTLTGTVAAIDAFLGDASAIKYTGAANAYGAAAATLTLSADDGDGNSGVALGTVRIDLTQVNDAPTATGLPGRVTVTEDVPTGLDLSGVVLADVDPADDDYTLVLSVTTGSLSAASGGGVAVSGSTTGTLTLSGSMAAVQAWLGTSGRVTYTGAADVNGPGAAILSLTGNDQDGSGATTFGTVAIDITAVNDAPVVGDLPDAATAYRNETAPLDLGAVRLSDIDGDILLVALSVDIGTLSATSGHGVVVAGSDSGALLLAGSASAIETFLRGARVSFTASVTGSEAHLTLEARDAHDGMATQSMAIGIENRPVAFQPPPRGNGERPAPAVAPPPLPMVGPAATDAPVSSAIQDALAGGGTGEVTSAILGRLGSVSGIETSGTPVGQAVRLQSQAPSVGTPGGLGWPPSAERTGSILGGGFGDLGALGRTDGVGDFDDIQDPVFDGAVGSEGEASAANGHRGLNWQMAAARHAVREPVDALAQALKALAPGPGA
ncbi:MAG: DUF4347 domain-containing protein [Rhodospirillaceae bacterium]